MLGFAAAFGVVFSPGGLAGAEDGEVADGVAIDAAAASPQVWLSPAPYGMVMPPSMAGFGSRDFMDLFSPAAPWAAASARVNVFKLHTQWVLNATDADLRLVVDDLNRRGIQIAVEAAGLTPTASCGAGVEGFLPNAPDLTRIMARRVAAAGGSLRYVALDEVFTFGSYLDRPGACHWTAVKVATEIAAYLQAVHSEFPALQVGLIESDTVPVAQIQTWLEAFKTATGAYPPFFHWDVDWQRADDWPQRAKALEQYSRSRGIPFGMIYNGNGDDATDTAWIQHADEHMAMYETLGGGRPDHVVFQSWHMHPRYLLPETDPSKFIWLVNRYFQTRTSVSLSVATSAVSGVLRDASGKAVAKAPVKVFVTPAGGDGQYGEYQVTGVVPPGATSAIAGLRVNAECDCGGSAKLSLYGMRYLQAGDPSSRVPNSDFKSGAAPWGAWGAAPATIRNSDRQPGASMFQLQVAAGQTSFLNSGAFSVTGGASFTFTVGAKVAPAATGSGYFTLVFLGAGGEITRVRVALEPAPTVYTATTSTTGTYSVKLGKMPSARVEVVGHYAGTATRWAAFARVVK
ncbi:MAG: hypothetical protein IT304_02510 [Dehalococcoidia bacterium]|nr:hypothetical protein [Dehalococcoidia bacterium]